MPIHHRRARTGLTMMEVSLALGVLVICAFLAWPVISGAFDIHHLKAAGTMMRDVCAEARLNAIGTGQIQVLRIKPESPYYLIEQLPQANLDQMLDLSQAGLQNPADNLRAPESIDWATEGKSLPKGTFFVTIENKDAKDESILNEIMSVEEDGVQKPLLFNPAGTTTTATIILRSEGNRYLEVNLDGLTGNVVFGDPFTTKSMDQPQVPQPAP